MNALIPIIVQLIGGGVGGNVIAQLVKSLNLGPVGNTIAGAIGGLILTWVAGKVPGLDGLVGAVASSTGGAAAGGVDVGALAGQGISGIVGGAVLTAIAGAIKNATAK
jgi:hypothetical protein